jgi:hypothetical protein
MSIPLTRRHLGFLPWRSATAGWIATVLALIAGIPLFLCMPPWNDVTLHDMAARSILRGGIHYRDVFDTNLPGIDWAMACIRLVFGWSYETLRAVDLAVIAAEAALLLVWVRRAGGAGYSVAWLAASAAMFYPFSSEFNHVQRDPWLLLPALVAALLRLSHTTNAMIGKTGQAKEGRLEDWRPLQHKGTPFRRSVLEGAVWGVAVWVKPHVIIPAGAMWAVAAIFTARRESCRRIILDLIGLVLGGLIVGAAGVAWMVKTGAWPYFLDVFLNWNPSYLDDMWGGTRDRAVRTFYCFRPWSILHIAAIPLAFLALWEARAWSREPGEPVKVWGTPRVYTAAGCEPVAAARALLAVFYLAWLMQATFLQKGLDYVQVPLLFLGMAVVATHRWAFGFAFVCWFAILAAILNIPFLAPLAQSCQKFWDETHEAHDPFTDFRFMRLWPRCWREGGSAELRDKLGHLINIHCGTNWEELEDVANFLKTVNPPIGPGELNCWHDSTHPLYLMLNLDPATRYMHYGTAFGIPGKVEVIAADVAASRQRYVVSDLLRMTWFRDEAYAPGAGEDPHRLPNWLPVSQRMRFPWNQPIVFRSGRYLVQKVEKPLGVIDIPDWEKLDKLGPGER